MGARPPIHGFRIRSIGTISNTLHDLDGLVHGYEEDYPDDDYDGADYDDGYGELAWPTDPRWRPVAAVIGAVIAIVVRPGARFAAGVKWASTFVLQCSVVLLGAQLSIAEAARVGVSSLPVMLGTLAVCLGAAWLYGRLLGVPGDLRTLIGVGTGICGGSAIAAVSPVIEAASADVAANELCASRALLRIEVAVSAPTAVRVRSTSIASDLTWLAASDDAATSVL